MPSIRLPLLFLLCTLPGAVAPVLAEPAIPPALAPWVPWVLPPRDQRPCPVDASGAESDGAGRTGIRVCAWPGRLYLDLDQQGGVFAQRWQVFAEAWVPLPGDADTWPQDLYGQNGALPVVGRAGLPVVKLAPGTQVLVGRFQWPRPPEGLTLPPETALLSLVLDGADVALPRVERGGRLWLGDPKVAGAGEEGDRLALKVFRRIEDDLPLRVITRLELDCAGGARQVSVGPVLLPGAIPLRVQSPLPSRLDPDGTLRAQVRPGHWVLEVEAQHPGSILSLGRGHPEAPWPELEVWSFAARPALRQVELSGPPAVDPRQSGVPADWSDLPAYRLDPGGTLTLTERRRGNPDPGPDRLDLQRDLWLDQAGKGYSVRDRITGQLTRSWRLEAAPPLVLGQVQVDGEPRLITRLTDADPPDLPGVEVRRGRLALVADSRLEDPAQGQPRRIPASGWGPELSSIRTVLHLPPGWDLLAASGVDNLPDSWISRWTLLDLFLVLILGIGVGRLWGVGWGLFAVLTLVLIWKVPEAPRLVWLHLLAAAALLRLVPWQAERTGMARLHGLVQWYFRLSLVALLLVGLPFLVSQVRSGLYPHLERPWAAMGLGGGVAHIGGARDAESDGRMPMADAMLQEEPAETSRQFEKSLDLKTLGMVRSAPVPTARPDQPEPGELVQSGAGIPDWQWKRFDLAWSGSVGSGEGAALWLLNPLLHGVWALLGAALTLVLGLRLAGMIGARVEPRPPRSSAPAPGPASEGRLSRSLALALGASLLLSALCGSVPGTARAADLPSPELLEELQERLLEPPDCLPDCVDLPTLALEADPGWLRLVLTLDAAAPVAAAVPGGPGGWLPVELRLDGTPLDLLRRAADGQFRVALSPGRHRLELAGPLPERSQVEIPFPLRPRQVSAALTGWTLEGLDAAGRPGPQIRLVRVSAPGEAADRALSQGALPPLVRIERTLRFGLDWRVQTRARRLSPIESPVALPVPLLPGESVQTPGMQVQDGQLLVNLAPGEAESTWVSTLEPTATLRLAAGQDPRVSESWSLDLSPRWHLTWSGPAPVQAVSEVDRWLPTWRPRPGDVLDISITRPAGVPGPTLTLDRVELGLTPGRRAAESQLTLSLRGTQGGFHPLRLPEGAVPTRFQADGQDLPLPPAGSALEVPLVPGAQSVLVQWREARPMAVRLGPSLPDLGAPAVNLNLSVRMPEDRWVLFAFGPPIGPVVLFWGVLLVLAVLALALGRVRLTPLKARDWLLLGIGLSLAQVWVLLLVGGWLLALGWRPRVGDSAPRWRYNLTQVALILLTLAALTALVGAVSRGLLGAPEMQILGNGSGRGLLRWYQDRTAGALPPVSVISVPMWVYRALMLAWALWLAWRLLDWLRWGWDGFSRPVLWREGESARQRGLHRGDAKAPG